MGDIWLEKILRLLNQLSSLTCAEVSCPNAICYFLTLVLIFFLFCRLLCPNLKQNSAGNSLPGKDGSPRVDGHGITDQFRSCILCAMVPARGFAFPASAAGFISIRGLTSSTRLGSPVCREAALSVCGQGSRAVWHFHWSALDTRAEGRLCCPAPADISVWWHLVSGSEKVHDSQAFHSTSGI